MNATTQLTDLLTPAFESIAEKARHDPAFRHDLLRQPRSALADVLGHSLRVKIVTLPDGSARVKPEFDDVQRIALATGRRSTDIYQLALGAAERL